MEFLKSEHKNERAEAFRAKERSKFRRLLLLHKPKNGSKQQISRFIPIAHFCNRRFNESLVYRNEIMLVKGAVK